MHVNWAQVRKHWVTAVASCTTPKEFARVLIVLQSCMKPAVFSPVWQEQLGMYDIWTEVLWRIFLLHCIHFISIS